MVFGGIWLYLMVFDGIWGNPIHPYGMVWYGMYGMVWYGKQKGQKPEFNKLVQRRIDISSAMASLIKYD